MYQGNGEVDTWGYGHMYPVAEIKGATYAQVSQWATASLIRQIGQASGEKLRVTYGVRQQPVLSPAGDIQIMRRTKENAPKAKFLVLYRPSNEMEEYDYTGK